MNTQGGARVGAGRKPLPEDQKVSPLAIRCYIPTATKFKAVAKRYGMTHRELLEYLLSNQ